MSSSNSSPPSGSQSPSFWGVFNPTSKEFHEAEDAFHTLGWHQQLAVIAASILGGIILPIAGAFPAFCWVANWIKNGEDTKNPDQLDKIGSATKHTLPNNTTNLATENKSTSPEGAPGKTTQATDPAKNSTSFVKPSDAPLPEGTTSHVIHGHKPLSITFSEEIKKAHNIPSLYTQKCSEDVRFQPVLEFIKRFKFDPPVDYNNLNSSDLLEITMLIANGSFSRSDSENLNFESRGYKNFVIQIELYKVLDPLIEQLYQDETLPKSLKKNIKEEYVLSLRQVFDFTYTYLIEGENENWKHHQEFISKTLNNPNLISLSQPLQFLIKETTGEPHPKDLTLKLKEQNVNSGPYLWALNSLGFEEKNEPRFLNIIPLLFLKMEDSGTPFILKNPEPVVSDDKFYDKNVYRLSQLFLELYNKDVNGFKEKFENSFPGENFESYKAQHLSSYDYFPASPNPLLFEIPLLTEALGTKVDCYIMDKEGNFSLKEIGPEGGAKASFALALNAINPNSAHFLSNL